MIRIKSVSKKPQDLWAFPSLIITLTDKRARAEMTQSRLTPLRVKKGDIIRFMNGGERFRVSELAFCEPGDKKHHNHAVVITMDRKYVVTRCFYTFKETVEIMSDD